MRIAALFLLACWMLSARAEPAPPCPPLDKACAMRIIAAHPAKQPAFWTAAMARPVEQRIGAAPPELIEILTLDNVAHGYPNKPHAPQLTDKFIADVKRVYAELPASLRAKVEPRLAGIYFVDDIGGTGFADQVFDPTGKAPLGFIVLDPSVLASRKANEWATWKDNTPFKPDPAWQLSARIEDAVRDDTAYAIQYILLHELGHILSIGADVHPSWTLDPAQILSTREFTYFNLSWRILDGKYVALQSQDFPQRKDLAFYFGAKLPASAMLETYTALEKTNFPTLYAATHPGDDFAEALANYTHVVLMGKPFEIRLTKNGKTVKSYGPCWKQKRCALKRAYLERFLKEAPEK